MAKTKYVNSTQLQKELFKRTEGYAANVRAIYQNYLLQIINLVKGTELEEGKPLSFSEYGYSDEATAIFREMYSRLYQEIRNDVQNEWLLSNQHNDELVKSVFGENSINDNHFARFFKRNMEAMDAFFARKTGEEGLSLSQKVWRYTGQFKEELENCLDLAIGEGTGANKLASKIQTYLQDPDRFYRRFRIKVGEDENGNTVYGRVWKRRVYDKETESYKWVDDNPKKYHPGRGVYRSSYRNAQRLARTETNIAYRTADFERWGQLDFIIGYEIKLSNNHPCHDICDELAGKYPKTFKWTGWHPNCRCCMIPILAGEDDIEDMLNKILAGEDEEISKREQIKEMPRKFTQWVKDNDERIKAATIKGTLPYFIKDNAKHIPILKYNTYGENWRRLWCYNNGGYVVSHVSRFENSKKSKNEQAKYEKETAMCRVLAQKGYQIEMLEEKSRKSSPDVLIDGVKADLKRVSGENNIVKYASYAVQKQEAEIVLFQFDKNTERVHLELLKLKRKNYKVLYFFTGEEKIYEL